MARRVVRFADRHGLAAVGNSDAHTLDAIGVGWTTFEGRTAADLRAAIEAGTTRHDGAFHGTAGQVGVFGDQLRKRPAMPATRSPAASGATAPAATMAIPAAGPGPRASTPASRGRAVKIGLVCPYIYPENGGVAQHVRFLYENLRLRGHDVRVLTASHGPQRSSEGDIIRLGVGFSVPINASVGTLTFSPRYLARSARCSTASGSTCCISMSRSCRSCRSSCCASRRASTSRRSMPMPASRRRTSSAAGPCAAMRPACTAGSRSARRPATSSTASSRATTRSSPTASTSARFANAVPIARWQDGTPNVLFVGRHEPRKGLLDLLKAHRILRKTGSDPRLLVVGSGPQEREARRYVATRGLQGVEFLGRVSDAEKAQLFRTADVYASPATGGESFGIVLLEAMAAGTPIVCSDIHGYKGVVRRGREGLLVPPREPRELADRHRPPAARPGAARADGRGRPGAGRGVQLAAGHGQGRRLLRLRDPPPGRRRQPAGRLPRRGPSGAAAGPREAVRVRSRSAVSRRAARDSAIASRQTEAE